MATMTCPICDGAVAPFSGAIAATVGTRTVTVHSEHEVCGDCGERFYSPEQAERFNQGVTAALRAEDGLLSPAEIREIRLALGLTQAGLEQLLGVGTKTVVRWERGTVAPNRATDTLLRCLHEVPGVVEFLQGRMAAISEQRTANREEPTFPSCGGVAGEACRGGLLGRLLLDHPAALLRKRGMPAHLFSSHPTSAHPPPPVPLSLPAVPPVRQLARGPRAARQHAPTCSGVLHRWMVQFTVVPLGPGRS